MPPIEVLDVWVGGIAAHGFAFVLGAVFGSFANVCIYRLPPSDEHPEGQSVVSPGSRCGGCGTPIRWYDNLPVFSWLLLRGQCRSCGMSYSPRYLFVEIATGLLFVAVFHLTVVLPLDEALPLRLGRFGIYALFSFLMVLVTFIDLDHKLILDKITYPSIPLLYGLSLALPERDWNDGLIGAVVGYGIVRLIADGYYLLTKREGMGYGDGKLLAMIGALFGWPAVLFSLFAGSLIGSIIGVAALVWARRRDASAAEPPPAPAGAGMADPQEEPVALRHQELPFGPFLVAGAMTYMFLESWVNITFGLLWG